MYRHLEGVNADEETLIESAIDDLTTSMFDSEDKPREITPVEENVSTNAFHQTQKSPSPTATTTTTTTSTAAPTRHTSFENLVTVVRPSASGIVITPTPALPTAVGGATPTTASSTTTAGTSQGTNNNGDEQNEKLKRKRRGDKTTNKKYIFF